MALGPAPGPLTAQGAPPRGRQAVAAGRVRPLRRQPARRGAAAHRDEPEPPRIKKAWAETTAAAPRRHRDPLRPRGVHSARACRISASRPPTELGRPYLLYTSDFGGDPYSHIEKLFDRAVAAMAGLWRRMRRYKRCGATATRFHAWLGNHTVPTRYYVAGYPPRPVSCHQAVCRQAHDGGRAIRARCRPPSPSRLINTWDRCRCLTQTRSRGTSSMRTARDSTTRATSCCQVTRGRAGAKRARMPCAWLAGRSHSGNVQAEGRRHGSTGDAPTSTSRFTCAGLQKLAVDDATLLAFPEEFRRSPAFRRIEDEGEAAVEVRKQRGRSRPAGRSRHGRRRPRQPSGDRTVIDSARSSARQAEGARPQRCWSAPTETDAKERGASTRTRRTTTTAATRASARALRLRRRLLAARDRGRPRRSRRRRHLRTQAVRLVAGAALARAAHRGPRDPQGPAALARHPGRRVRARLRERGRRVPTGPPAPLGPNGTFMVYREIEQHVDGFDGT